MFRNFTLFVISFLFCWLESVLDYELVIVRVNRAGINLQTVLICFLKQQIEISCYDVWRLCSSCCYLRYPIEQWSSLHLSLIVSKTISS